MRRRLIRPLLAASASAALLVPVAPQLWVPSAPAIIRKQAPLVTAMLPGMMMPMAPASSALQTLMSVITTAGLTSGLQFCLDGFDPACTSNAAKFLTASGSGQDFFRGVTGSTSGDEPTLNAGGYFTFDGGDLFQYDTTNETWMTACHEDNAAYSFLFAVYLTDTNSDFLGTVDASFGTKGIRLYGTTSGDLILKVTRAAGTFALDKTTDGSILSTGQWLVLGVSIGEAAGASGGFFYKNGAYAPSGSSNQWNPAYTSPASGAAPFSLQLGGSAGERLFDSGSRMGFCAAWNTALTKANFDSIYAGIQARYGL